MSKASAVSMSAGSSSIQLTVSMVSLGASGARRSAAILVAGRVGAGQPLRRGEARLQRNIGVDLDAAELGEAGAEQAQPLLGIVVAVEEELRVRGVVMALVERLELAHR